MLKKVCLLLNVAGLAAVLAVAGCNNRTSGSGVAVDETGIVFANTQTKQTYESVKEKGRSLLQARDFAAIEKQAAQHRKSRAKDVEGYWQLSAFYLGVAEVPESVPAAQSEAEWETRRKTLTDWAQRSPRSVTAHVALARCYHDGAYQARGEGWSSTVGKDQRQIMNERLEKGMEVLSESADLRSQCPGWFAAAQRILFLAGSAKAEFDEITDEGLRLFPDYDDFHFMRAKYLMARWYGKQGDWPAYAAQAADTTAKRSNSQQSDALYARIVWFMHRYCTGQTPRELDGIDWPRTKRGFEVLMKGKDRLAVAGPYARVAFLSEDLATTKKLFQNPIGNKMDEDVWMNTNEFARARQWALGG